MRTSDLISWGVVVGVLVVHVMTVLAAAHERTELELELARLRSTLGDQRIQSARELQELKARVGIRGNLHAATFAATCLRCPECGLIYVDPAWEKLCDECQYPCGVDELHVEEMHTLGPTR